MDPCSPLDFCLLVIPVPHLVPALPGGQRHFPVVGWQELSPSQSQDC